MSIRSSLLALTVCVTIALAPSLLSAQVRGYPPGRGPVVGIAGGGDNVRGYPPGANGGDSTPPPTLSPFVQLTSANGVAIDPLQTYLTRTLPQFQVQDAREARRRNEVTPALAPILSPLADTGVNAGSSPLDDYLTFAQPRLQAQEAVRQLRQGRPIEASPMLSPFATLGGGTNLITDVQPRLQFERGLDLASHQQQQALRQIGQQQLDPRVLARPYSTQAANAAGYDPRFQQTSTRFGGADPRINVGPGVGAPSLSGPEAYRQDPVQQYLRSQGLYQQPGLVPNSLYQQRSYTPGPLPLYR